MTVTPNNISSSEKGSFFAEKKRAIALTTALALGPAALAGCAPGNAEAQPQASHSAEATTGSNTGETVDNGEVKIDTGNQTVEHAPAVTPETLEAVVAANRIESSLSPEEKAKKLAETISEWLTAGATPDSVATNRKNISEAVQPQNEALASEIADGNTEAYAPAVFGETYHSNPIVAELEQINVNNIIRFDTTFNSDEFPAYGTPSEEAYTESWSDNVHLEGFATPTEVSLPILEGDKNEAKDVLGDQPFTILSYTAVRSNNAENTNYSSDASYAENDGRTIYMNALLVPKEDGYDEVKYLKMSDDPITDIDYRSIPQ